MSTLTTPNATASPGNNKAGGVLASDEAGLAWFKGIGLEWGKITWPTRMQLFTYVIVVLLMTGVMTLFIWLIDTAFRWGIHLITPDKAGL
ncbi:MAG: preprotein translocase subunit SecE [Candidatus Melainabacteria bacterium]|jgi:preprotein translocase SecE subunit|nr:preprotein translocase subunit SecE [Candidatus Melainabacteria bacterium]